MPKYSSENLAPMFRLAAKLCVRMRKAGFTDNGGAIHSAERIINIWGLHLTHPGLSHINNLKKFPSATFSVKAHLANRKGEKVFIEHEAPLRDLTKEAIKMVQEGADDEAIQKFIRRKFRLVLLTADEAARLNRRNRSKIEPNRLAKSGIKLRKPKVRQVA